MSVASSDRVISGPHGGIPIRVYRPEGRVTVGLVWAHGGSFVGGNLEMAEADQVGRELAARGIAVVSVDYRLGPISEQWAGELGIGPRAGALAPIPQDDVTAALVWARTADLGPEATAWSLGGASAGASIAASATLWLRDIGTAPHSIVLVYPTLHAELPAPSAELAATMRGSAESERFRPERVRRMNENHVGGRIEKERLRAFAGGQDLTGLPPVLLLNAEYDDLRASGEAFARELADAHIRVAASIEPGTTHGYLNIDGDPAAMRSINTIACWLRAGLHP